MREDFKANPLLSANNYQAYPASGFPALTAAPAGYEPFFINHYGRHGSRWLINEKKYTYPLQMLEKGERNGKLTRRGQEVLDILRQVHSASKGRLGELSDIGHEQHQQIAAACSRISRRFFRMAHPSWPARLSSSAASSRCRTRSMCWHRSTHGCASPPMPARPRCTT